MAMQTQTRSTTIAIAVRQTFAHLIDAGVALFYPQTCAECGASVERRAQSPACEACWRKTLLFEFDELACWKCGARAQVASIWHPLTTEQREHIRCHRCDAETWSAARAVGSYDAALRAAVLHLKREPFISPRLIKLLHEWQQRSPLNTATRIIPVPLHAERERERGFNQAAIIARALARRAHLPLDEASLVRTKYTERHRAGMDTIARRSTVEDAFAVARPRLVKGEHILLIDDVFTTGATASACATALLKADARRVSVLTLARAG